MTEKQDASENETVFACNMAAIEPSQRKEHIENTKLLLDTVQTIEDRPDGYALILPLNTAALVQTAQFIALERLCCPFFGFNVELAPAASNFGLVLTGPTGVKPFILAELELSYPAGLKE